MLFTLFVSIVTFAIGLYEGKHIKEICNED